MSTHTPTPWRVAKDPMNPNPRIHGADKELVTVVSEGKAFAKPTDANAAFIVKAVNAYEKDQETIKELLATVKALHRDKWWQRPKEIHDALCNLRIHEAIAKAEEK